MQYVCHERDFYVSQIYRRQDRQKVIPKSYFPFGNALKWVLLNLFLKPLAKLCKNNKLGFTCLMISIYSCFEHYNKQIVIYWPVLPSLSLHCLYRCFTRFTWIYVVTCTQHIPKAEDITFFITQTVIMLLHSI